MKLIICVLNISLTGILLFNAASVGGNEDTKKEAWRGTLSNGASIDESDLKEILNKHVKMLNGRYEGQWTDLRNADLRGADLNGAILSMADLSGAKLNKAKLIGAELIEAKLNGVDLSGADLSEAMLNEAELKGANLRDAKLRGVILVNAYLKDAKLRGAILVNAYLKHADLSGADLSRADLTGADLTGADLTGAILAQAVINGADFNGSVFEPKDTEGLVYLGAKGFSNIKFKNIDPVVALRKKVKEAGFRQLERQLTAALRKHRRTTITFENIFLDYPTDFGADPWRSLRVFGVLLIFFSIPYMISLKRKGRDGIWIEWVPGRLRKDLGEKKPTRLFPRRTLSVIWFGFYFSLLSAFHIGWKDLNVGSWIARLQPREYILKATGWVRVVSGVQSLISIYLLALWALTYFARPFD